MLLFILYFFFFVTCSSATSRSELRFLNDECRMYQTLKPLQPPLTFMCHSLRSCMCTTFVLFAHDFSSHCRERAFQCDEHICTFTGITCMFHPSKSVFGRFLWKKSAKELIFDLGCNFFFSPVLSSISSHCCKKLVSLKNSCFTRGAPSVHLIRQLQQQSRKTAPAHFVLLSVTLTTTGSNLSAFM